MTLRIRSLDELTKLGKQVSHVLHARSTWPAHDVVRLTQSAVTREPSAWTEAQDSSPEVMEPRTYARMCRTANQASLFIVAVYCVYEW